MWLCPPWDSSGQETGAQGAGPGEGAGQQNSWNTFRVILFRTSKISSQSFFNSNPKVCRSSLIAIKELLLNFGLELKKLHNEFYQPTERISE